VIKVMAFEHPYLPANSAASSTPTAHLQAHCVQVCDLCAVKRIREPLHSCKHTVCKRVIRVQAHRVQSVRFVCSQDWREPLQSS